MWLPKNTHATVASAPVYQKLSLIAAIDTEGRVYAALSQVNTDSDMFLLFMHSLTKKLDEETPGWREDTVVLLDGARYHMSEASRAFLAKMRLDVVFTGPYAAPSSPIEKLFAHLKKGDLNPLNLPTN